jgi:hypothetical protein
MKQNHILSGLPDATLNKTRCVSLPLPRTQKSSTSSANAAGDEFYGILTASSLLHCRACCPCRCPVQRCQHSCYTENTPCPPGSKQRSPPCETRVRVASYRSDTAACAHEHAPGFRNRERQASTPASAWVQQTSGSPCAAVPVHPQTGSAGRDLNGHVAGLGTVMTDWLDIQARASGVPARKLRSCRPVRGRVPPRQRRNRPRASAAPDPYHARA